MNNLKEEYLTSTEEDFLFEIDDSMYFIMQFGFLLMSIWLFFFSYIINDFNFYNMFHHNHRSFMIIILTSSMFIRQIIVVPMYFIRRDRKIRFYSTHIQRTKKRMNVNLNKLTEAYILKMSFLSDALNDRSGNATVGKIIFFTIGIIIVLPMWLSFFLLSLHNIRFSFYMDNLIVIENNGSSAVSIPLKIITKNDFLKVENYFKTIVHKELKDIEHRFIEIPNNPKKNF